MGLRLRRGLARHARPARRQGRQRRRDDARARAPSACPAGFTITTEACVAYMRDGRLPRRARRRRSTRRWRRSRSRPARSSATPSDPLLVSVRSGARESMPGMLDTVLNLGLNDESVEGLAEQTEQRALRVGLLPALRADVRQRRARASRASASRTRSSASRPTAASRTTPSSTSSALQELTRSFKELLRVPARTRSEQLEQAIRAVFDSWNGERAVDLPAHQPHPRRLGHRGQRAADGLRQQGRRQRLRRRLQPRRGHRRARAQRRLPRQRPGRGRRLRRAQHAATSPSSSDVHARGPRRS